MYQSFGGAFVPESSSDAVGPEHKNEAATALTDKLSAGQLEVLRLVDQHLSSKEIAARLGISPHTVDQRIRNAIRILGVARRQDAARLVARAEPYQRLIHQAPHLDPEPIRTEEDGAVSYQIRHADRAEGIGSRGELDTEQGTLPARSPLVLPWSTRSNPRNQMSIGQRLLWIVGIAIGASFSAGMYLAGLESLARMAGH